MSVCFCSVFCMCTCVSVCTCMCECVHMEARDGYWGSSSIVLLLSFWDRASRWAWSSPIWVDRLGSSPQGFSCHLCRVLGYTYVAMPCFYVGTGCWTQFSCLHGKHFASLAISPYPWDFHMIALCSEIDFLPLYTGFRNSTFKKTSFAGWDHLT